jgi:hypothetical protein
MFRQTVCVHNPLEAVTLQEREISALRSFYQDCKLPSHIHVRAVEDLDGPLERTRVHYADGGAELEEFARKLVAGGMPVVVGSDERGEFYEF